MVFFMSSKEDIIKDMYYFYLSNFQHTQHDKEFVQDLMKRMFEDCVEPYMYIKDPEQYTVLQNGFSPNISDLDPDVQPKNH